MKVISKRIEQLQDEKYQLIQNSQDIKEILEHCGITEDTIEDRTTFSMQSIEVLFVEIGDGEYYEIWASNDIYCYLHSRAYLIYKEGGIDE